LSNFISLRFLGKFTADFVELYRTSNKTQLSSFCERMNNYLIDNFLRLISLLLGVTSASFDQHMLRRKLLFTPHLGTFPHLPPFDVSAYFDDSLRHSQPSPGFQ